jgi:hypothetical protein
LNYQNFDEKFGTNQAIMQLCLSNQASKSKIRALFKLPDGGERRKPITMDPTAVGCCTPRTTPTINLRSTGHPDVPPCRRSASAREWGLRAGRETEQRTGFVEKKLQSAASVLSQLSLVKWA